MEKSKTYFNKNQIFNRALYISIPEDDINGDNLNNGLKPLDNYYNGIEISGKDFLTSSLLKKIEEGTPVSDKQIIIDLDNLKNTDSDNLNFIGNNNNLLENEKYKNNIFKKSSFIKNINFDNTNENNINSNNNNIEYFQFQNNFFFEENLKKEKNKKLNDKEKIKFENLKDEEYIFKKFGKRGWQCSKCNNFNFESRIKCNRCSELKSPKTLIQIKKETEEKNLGDKKKKILIEKKGDWQCPKCHNLNFAFRKECNRCHLNKEIYFNFKNYFQGNNTFENNSINKPQIIRNHINFIENLDFSQNKFDKNRIWNKNINCNNNINNDNFYSWNYQSNSSNNNQINNFYALK